MNIYLLELVGKWLSFIFVSFISLFNVNVYQEEAIKVELSVKGEEDINIVDKKIEYPKVVNNTEQVEIASEPITVEPVIEVEKPILEEQISYEEYIGKVTGYGPDCYGCSGRGNLACHTKNGGIHNLYDNGVYYDDETYGSVRIVAAAKDKFPCGTIVDIVKDGVEPMTVVVLDRGGDMNKAWLNEQTVWLDLAYDSIASAKLGNMSGVNIKFIVKRWGW